MRVYQATDIGHVRSTNEDAVLSFEPDTYLVADGMGGHAAGEVASRILAETVRLTLSARSAPWREQELKDAMFRANEEILARVKEQPQYRGMGTTATLLHFHEKTAYYAHVGDSRLYLMRGGSLQQVTRDHSYVEELVAQGSITREEAKRHPRRNLLTRAVGVQRELAVDTGNFAVEPGDRYLLCTDGLTNMVSDEEILAVLQTDEDPAESLLRKALDAGGTDNITILAVVYDNET